LATPAQPDATSGFNPNKFATLAGLAAYAISPDTAGGRLGGVAASYGMQQEQQRRYDEALRQQQAQQAQDKQDRSRRLGGLLSRLQTPVGAYSPQEPTSGTPGYEDPGTLGVPPVGFNVEGIGAGARPPLSATDTAELISLFGPQAAQMLNYFEGTGQLAGKPVGGAPGYGLLNRTTGAPIGSGVPLTPVQAAPVATLLGSSRPGYTDPRTGVVYPAVQGQFSARASIVPVNPGQGLGGLSPEGTPQVFVPAVPPATSRTASRPAWTDPTTGEVHPAVGPLFTPQEEAVIGPAGSTIIPAPGESPIVAKPTFRQSTVSVGPGGSAVTAGGKVTTAPQTERQKTTGTVSGGKPGKPTQFDKQVEAWANEFSTYQPTEDATWLGGYAGTPSLSPQQQAQAKIKQTAITDPTSARIMQQAYFQAFGGGRGAAPQGSTDPLEGQTATGPSGRRLIRQNGQWVPYNGS